MKQVCLQIEIKIRMVLKTEFDVEKTKKIENIRLKDFRRWPFGITSNKERLSFLLLEDIK